MASLNTPKNSAHLGGVTWVKITIPLTVITVGFVGLRVWWRLKQMGRIGRSDIAVIGAVLMAVAQEIIGCVGILKYGFGHHAAFLGPEKVHNALMYFYIYQIPYKILVCLTKMSFLFLYLDIFINPKFQKICWIVNGSVIAALFAFTLTTIFQCTPIEYNWNRTIPGGGHCINAPAFWYGHAAWNTALDILILFMPVPVIRSLQMPKNQKYALIGIFALGAFVCVTSIMRMITLDIAAKSTATDLTYATGQAFIWTQVESDVGIICCCLPTLKVFLTRYMPGIFGKKSWNNSGNAYNLEDVSKRSVTSKAWKDNSNYQSQAAHDADASSSQEEIMGIKRTVNVSVTRKDGLEDYDPQHHTQFPNRDAVRK